MNNPNGTPRRPWGTTLPKPIGHGRNLALRDREEDRGGISFLVELKGRALALKQQGESADQAGQQITAEFKKKYPD